MVFKSFGELTFHHGAGFLPFTPEKYDLIYGKKLKLNKNTRKKALKYSWEKIAEKYLKVFEETLKPNNSSP